MLTGLITNSPVMKFCIVFLEHNKGLKIIAVTTFLEKYISEQVPHRGVKGYFYKNGDRFENIITCIEKVFSGKNCFARK